MIEERRPLPKWILILTGFFGLLELIISLGLWFSPESVLDKVDLTANGVKYLIQMWAVRQFAIGFILAFATFKKSAAMLTIAYVFLLVMFLGDIVVGISQNEYTLVVAGLIMCIISSALLYVINKKP
jgi:hypothetical protein